MWIAFIRDNETGEIFEIFLSDISELQKLLDLIKMNPNLDISNIEEHYLISDVDNFKEIITGDDNG